MTLCVSLRIVFSVQYILQRCTSHNVDKKNSIVHFVDTKPSLLHDTFDIQEHNVSLR